jgi:hypothetical protein
VQMVMRLNPGRVETFYLVSRSCRVAVLLCTYKELLKQKLYIFRRSITIHHFRTLYQVALPPHKFVRSPCLYYQLWEIRKVRAKSNANSNFRWHNVHTKFNRNPSSGSRVKSYGQTDGQIYRQPYVRSLCAHRKNNAKSVHKTLT